MRLCSHWPATPSNSTRPRPGPITTQTTTGSASPYWTEPCAIVDSFIVSQELWEFTGEAAYLQDAHHIFYNAIAHAGRRTAPSEPIIAPVQTWIHRKVSVSMPALLMRPQNNLPAPIPMKSFGAATCGGDGLSRAYQYSHYIDGDTVTFPYFHSSKVILELDSGTLKLRQKANYPASGTVRFTVEDSTTGNISLKFFAPEA